MKALMGLFKSLEVSGDSSHYVSVPAHFDLNSGSSRSNRVRALIPWSIADLNHLELNPQEIFQSGLNEHFMSFFKQLSKFHAYFICRFIEPTLALKVVLGLLRVGITAVERYTDFSQAPCFLDYFTRASTKKGSIRR